MKRKVVSIIILMVFLAGCATLGLKQWSDRTPKEKAIAFMQFYNAQYKDTFNMATSGTPAQKELAMAKKKILLKLYPLIRGYDEIVVLGQIPSLDLENSILGHINALGGKL